MKPSEKEAVILSTSQKIKEKKESELLHPLERAISTACMIKGIGTLTKEGMRVMAQYLSNYCIQNFKVFTIEEICKAIEKGANGELRQDSDLNSVNIELIIAWVKRYDVNIRRPALHAFSHVLEQQKKEIDISIREEAESRLKATINDYYKEYKNGVKFEDLFSKIDYQYGYVAVLYDYLDKNGKISLTIDEKKEVYNHARHVILNEKRESVSKNFFTGGNFDLEVKNKAKYLGLKKEFEKWKTK